MLTALPVAVPSASECENVENCDTAISATSVITDKATSFCNPLNLAPIVFLLGLTGRARARKRLFLLFSLTALDGCPHQFVISVADRDCCGGLRLREHVTPLPNCFDGPRIALAQFLPQARDVDVQRYAVLCPWIVGENLSELVALHNLAWLESQPG